MKVGTLVPLGPALHRDPTHGRATLAWGSASYGVGGEDAEAFWWRVYVEALRRGLGTPAVRTVVVLGDGAHWIWERARAFLGLPGVEVVEIVDIYHAYGYLWAVSNALYGAGSLRAAAWVEPLKDQLYLYGAAPVLAALTALAALTPTTEEALHARTDAQTYFGASPAVKPSPACAPCSARGAGRPSGRPTPTSTGRRRRMPPTPPVAAAAAPRPAVTTAPPLPATAPRVARPAAVPHVAPRPKPTPAQRPLLLPRSA